MGVQKEPVFSSISFLGQRVSFRTMTELRCVGSRVPSALAHRHSLFHFSLPETALARGSQGLESSLSIVQMKKLRPPLPWEQIVLDWAVCPHEVVTYGFSLQSFFNWARVETGP